MDTSETTSPGPGSESARSSKHARRSSASRCSCSPSGAMTRRRWPRSPRQPTSPPHDLRLLREQGRHPLLRRAIDVRAARADAQSAAARGDHCRCLREFVPALGESDEQTKLRKRIIGRTRALRLSERGRSGQMEQLVADSIAKDLGDIGPDDVRPRLIAASVTAAFSAVRDRLKRIQRSQFTRGGTGDPRPGDRVPPRRARSAAASQLENGRGTRGWNSCRKYDVSTMSVSPSRTSTR